MNELFSSAIFWMGLAIGGVIVTYVLLFDDDDVPPNGEA